MQANKSKDTGPELLVRTALRAAGYPGYRLHWKKAPGHPDICFPGRKLAIFVNGCYWHRCPYCTGTSPKTNVAFWENKFARNQARDQRDQELLSGAGWDVVVVRECRLKHGRAPAILAALVEELGVRSAEAASHEPLAGRVVELCAPEAWHLARAHGRMAAVRRRNARH